MAEKLEKNADREQNIVIDYQFSDSISLSTLVKLLVEKGIILPDELIACEKEYQNAKQRAQQQENENRKTFRNWIRQKAKKYWWLRRITARMFGWDWKKKRRYQKV